MHYVYAAQREKVHLYESIVFGCYVIIPFEPNQIVCSFFCEMA
jgi:uncharacterized membrane protein (GlpM family)